MLKTVTSVISFSYNVVTTAVVMLSKYANLSVQVPLRDWWIQRTDHTDWLSS